MAPLSRRLRGLAKFAIEAGVTSALICWISELTVKSIWLGSLYCDPENRGMLAPKAIAAVKIRPVRA